MSRKLFLAGLTMLVLTLLFTVLWVQAQQTRVQPTPRLEIPHARVVLSPRTVPYKVEYRLARGQTMETLSNRLPRELPLYRSAPDTKSAQQMVSQVADFFQLPGQLRASEDESGVQVLEDGGRILELRDVSGSVFAGDMNRLWAQGPANDSTATAATTRATTVSGVLARPVLTIARLGNAAVQERALNFLRSIGAPLPEKPAEFVVAVSQDDFQIARPTPGQAGTMVRGQQVTTVRGPAQVCARPLVNGLPMVGPGGKLKVFMDMEGKVAGCFIVMRSREQAQAKAALLPLADAARQFEQGGALAALTLTTPDRIVIRDISVGYFSKSAVQAQEFLQPVYVFEGTAYGRAGENSWKVPYEQYLPALKEVPEPLWPVGVVFKAGPRIKLTIPVDQDEQ